MLNAVNTLKEEFEALNGLRILVLGDVMIDSYLWGKTDRISPEAPVPILSVEKREKRLGGAANVAKNLRALGVEAIVVSVIGSDLDGQEMLNLFEKNDLSTEGLVVSENRVTTIKHRIISDKHLLRVDSEQTTDISSSIAKELLDKFEFLIPEADVVIFQDYNKGVLSSDVIKHCIKICEKNKVPTTVDPKKKNFSEYKNVTLFKPNLVEINEGLGLDLKGDNVQSIVEVARGWLVKQGIEKVLITLSEYGAVLVTQNNEEYVKAHERNIIDVSGAGDTVISVASAFLGMGSSDEKILQYSNLSGGLVCEKMGVVPVNKKSLIEEASKIKV